MEYIDNGRLIKVRVVGTAEKNIATRDMLLRLTSLDFI